MNIVHLLFQCVLDMKDISGNNICNQLNYFVHNQLWREMNLSKIDEYFLYLRILKM